MVIIPGTKKVDFIILLTARNQFEVLSKDLNRKLSRKMFAPGRGNCGTAGTRSRGVTLFMDALNSSKSPLKALKSSVSASCSIQSHLSTTYSQQRLRAASASSIAEKRNELDIENGFTGVSPLQWNIRRTLEGYTSRAPFKWTSRLWKFGALSYCMFCVVVMSLRLVPQHIHSVENERTAPSDQGLLLSSDLFARLSQSEGS
jgi:hypothetical protein